MARDARREACLLSADANLAINDKFNKAITNVVPIVTPSEKTIDNNSHLIND